MSAIRQAAAARPAHPRKLSASSNAAVAKPAAFNRSLVASGHAIPTVIITAHPEEVMQSRARDVGICCYLSKPFAPDELLECVGEALAKPQRGAIPRS